ncbi:MAG: signal peptidase I [Chloroflexi bacterium]|nr:signal peptidase I [Chloroflexota bacterium]
MYPYQNDSQQLPMDMTPMPALYETPSQEGRSLRQRGSGLFREVFQTALLVIILYTGLNLFIPRYIVEGHSMEPSFYDHERIVVSRLHYILGDPQRGDVVVLDLDNQIDLLKRIVALPGETVTMDEGQIFINGVALDEPYVAELCQTYSCQDRQWVLGDDEYFVLGDNRNHSRDSHDFGPIKRSQIIGKVLMKYWPPSDWSWISGQDYTD